MKTISLNRVENALSDSEMKLVKGGDPVVFEVDAPLLADDGGIGFITGKRCRDTECNGNGCTKSWDPIGGPVLGYCNTHLLGFVCTCD